MSKVAEVITAGATVTGSWETERVTGEGVSGQAFGGGGRDRGERRKAEEEAV